MANGQETNEALNIAQNNIQQEQQRRDSDNFGKAQGQKTSGVLSSLKEAFSNVDLSFDSSSISDAFLEAPEKLSRQDIFPALDQPLKVGNAGGSETGNIPIFVGGGDVFPTEIINARVRALSKGAKKTREENKKLEESFEFLDTADQFEGALNGQLIDLTEEFRGKYRNNWRKASKDPEFRKRYAELKSNAGRFSALSEKAVGILAAVKDGKQHVPKIAKDAAAKIANGSKNFEDLTKEEIFALEKDMITFESMTSGATRLASKIEKDFTTEFETLSLDDKKIVNEHLSNMKAGDFSGLAVIKKTMPNFDRVSTVANSDYDNGSYGAIDNQGRREDYINTVWSLMGSKSEVSFQKLTTEEEQRVTDAKLKDQQDRTRVAQSNARTARINADARKTKADNDLLFKQQKEATKAAAKTLKDSGGIMTKLQGGSIPIDEDELFGFGGSGKVQAEAFYELNEQFAVESSFNPQEVIVTDADQNSKVSRSVNLKEVFKGTPNGVVQVAVFANDVKDEAGNIIFNAGSLTSGLDEEQNSFVRDGNGNILPKYATASRLFVSMESNTDIGDGDKASKILMPYSSFKESVGELPLENPNDTYVERKGQSTIPSSSNLATDEDI